MILVRYLCFLLLMLPLAGEAQIGYQPTEENLEARAWFEDAKFGMFIHWGLSSSLAQGEWVMNIKNIKADDYNGLMNGFYPHDFDAKKWVATAKNAGMEYVTFITRHHDGFSNWDTQQSDFKITNTPYGKDIVKQLADECHAQGVKLFLYYSLLDWSHEDYQHKTGRTGHGSGRIVEGNWDNYIAFMKAQLTELLTNYGEIAGIWFDGHWDQLDSDRDVKPSKVDWHYDEIYGLIHELQPSAMIGNNHHLAIKEGEDFQMFEKDLPGENHSGYSAGATVSSLPLETCETINGAWGYNILDHNYKSTKELIHYLVKASGFGANFLLNIGPKPDGSIQEEFTERLSAMGDWLKTYDTTIKGSRAGFQRPNDQLSITQKGDKIYLHILENTETLALRIPYEIDGARSFIGGREVPYTKVGMKDYFVFDLSNLEFHEFDTVIVLTKK